METQRLIKFWLSLISLIFFYVNLQFYSGWIYPADPFLLIPKGLLGHVGTFLGGLIVAPLAAAFLKHGLNVFSNPGGTINKSLYTPLSKLGMLLLIVTLTVSSYVLISKRPMMHLYYEQGVHPPQVKVNGRVQPFKQSSLGLLTDRGELDVVLIDTLGFFRHRVDKQKDGKWLFPYVGHFTVDVSKVLPQRDFSVSYFDPLGKEHESIMFKLSEQRQIPDEDAKLKSLPIKNFEILLKEVFEMVFSCKKDYWDESEGEIVHGKRRFMYSYLGKRDKLKLEIRDTNETSKLAREPESGFRNYRNASQTVRESMICEFRLNLPGLIGDRLKRIYTWMWESSYLQTDLKGTPEEREGALEFISRTFEISGRFIPEQQAIRKIKVISKTNLVVGEGEPVQLKLAVDSICAIAKNATEATRHQALDVIKSYFINLGPHSNNIKVDAARSLVGLITSESTIIVTKKVLQCISQIYRRAHHTTQEGIRQVISEKLSVGW